MKRQQQKSFKSRFPKTTLALLISATGLSAQQVIANDEKVISISASRVANTDNVIEVAQNGESFTHTTKQHAPMGVRGYVRCHWNADYDGAHWVYGKVNTAGGEFHPASNAFVENTNKGVSWAIGKNSPMEGVSPHMLQIPISHMTGSAGDTHLDPVQACNNQLDTHVNNGGNRLNFLKQDHVINVQRNFALVARCRYNGVGHMRGYAQSNFNASFRLRCKGNPNLKPKPAGEDAPETVKAPLHTTQANLKAIPGLYTGECPATIKFNGMIGVSEPNQPVKYRIVGAKGFSSPVYTRHTGVAKNSLHVQFETVVGKKSKGFGLKAAPSQNSGVTSFDFKAVPSNRYTGWDAIQVLEPSKKTSNQAHLSVTCKKKLDAGNGLKSPGGSKPKPVPGPKTLSADLNIHSVSVASTRPVHNGACPAVLDFVATIKGSGKGMLQGQWSTNQGYLGSPVNIQYTGGVNKITKKIKINHQQSGVVSFKLNGANGKFGNLNYQVSCKLPLKTPENGNKEPGGITSKPMPKTGSLLIKSN